MKKVLSVALASAMVLGMGANAFAISYSTGSNNEADWPNDFQFDGELFVTNKDGDIIEEATTELNDNESVDFEPGDVIWMPLYADDQLSMMLIGLRAKMILMLSKASNWMTLFTNTTVVNSEEEYYYGQDGKWYTHDEVDTSSECSDDKR